MPLETSTQQRERAGEAARETRDNTQEMKEQAREKASGATQQAREKASEMANEARDRAEDTLEEQKDQATGQLGSISSALRQTSDSLRQEQQEGIAGYVESAAEQVDRLSRYVRGRSVGDLLAEVEDVARREPALFMGGAMLMGIFGARFLKSSQRNGSGRRVRTQEHARVRHDFETEQYEARDRRMEPVGTEPGEVW